MLIEIKNRWGGSVLFAHDAEENSLAVTLAMAIKARAYLRGADLGGADLRDANLRNANLRDAYLYGANLYGANLGNADLRDAYLGNADLRNANLGDANLRDADLRNAYLRDDIKLIGDRPILTIGPIGSESRTIFAYVTDKGMRIRAGCFFGTRDEFVNRLDQTHGANRHGQEYRAALVLIDAHAEIWAPES